MPLRGAGLVHVTQNEKYRQYAQQAQEQLERAPDDADRAAWLLIAQNWLNLLVQNDPKAESSSR
jgi:hypothetical protein